MNWGGGRVASILGEDGAAGVAPSYGSELGKSDLVGELRDGASSRRQDVMRRGERGGWEERI